LILQNLRCSARFTQYYQLIIIGFGRRTAKKVTLGPPSKGGI